MKKEKAKRNANMTPDELLEKIEENFETIKNAIVDHGKAPYPMVLLVEEDGCSDLTMPSMPRQHNDTVDFFESASKIIEMLSTKIRILGFLMFGPMGSYIDENGEKVVGPCVVGFAVVMGDSGKFNRWVQLVSCPSFDERTNRVIGMGETIRVDTKKMMDSVEDKMLASLDVKEEA